MTDSFSSFILSAENVFQAISLLLATVAILFAVFQGIASLRRETILRPARISEPDLVIDVSEVARDIKTASEPEKPFETTALANYYNQVLSRANISFWFSITFASIGFGVIIFAFVTHNAADVTGTVIKVLSGVVIDAVSSLFFVQSTAAQKSMAEFFEKLRLDRLNAEAREMIGEIESVDQRDRLRAQLILKYSGVDKLLTDIEDRNRMSAASSA